MATSDAIAAIGVVLVVVGVGWLSPALGFIVGGGVLCVVAVELAKREAGRATASLGGPYAD